MVRVFSLFLFLLVASAIAAGPRNVAVLDFRSDNSQISKEDLSALTTRFEAELQSTQVYRVVERRDMASILQEQGFQQSGACDASDCQVKVGQLLGVDLIVSGTFQKLDKVVSLTVKMVNVESGVVEKSHIIDIEGSVQDMMRAGCTEMALVMAGKKQPEGERQVLTVKKTLIWPWIVGGAAVVVAGVATALILTQDDSGHEDRTTGTPYNPDDVEN